MGRPSPSSLLICALWLAAAACSSSPRVATRSLQVITGDHDPPLAARASSLKFAIIGDSGRWSTAQRDAAVQLAAERKAFEFDLVLMLGDNNYGDGSPESFRVRFEAPYEALLKAGVTFRAVRGNHDVGPLWEYPLFNMGGQRYYTFSQTTGVLPPLAGNRVQFFALDSVDLDDEQVSWFDRQLSESTADWTIVFFHHPLYSSGRYAMESALRRSSLERALIEHEVDVVFSGHEHFYERMKPQSGVMYFIVGAAGDVRVGDLQPSPYRAIGYDRDLSFLLAEIAGDSLYFRAVDRAGETVDRGKIVRTKPSP
jgi:3',5'-cyclic AMP phosphodiesterase CpdA